MGDSCSCSENWKHEHEYKFVDDRLAEVKNPNHIGALLEKLRERTGERYLCIQSSLLWKSRMTVDSVLFGSFFVRLKGVSRIGLD